MSCRTSIEVPEGPLASVSTSRISGKTKVEKLKSSMLSSEEPGGHGLAQWSWQDSMILQGKSERGGQKETTTDGDRGGKT